MGVKVFKANMEMSLKGSLVITGYFSNQAIIRCMKLIPIIPVHLAEYTLASKRFINAYLPHYQVFTIRQKPIGQLKQWHQNGYFLPKIRHHSQSIAYYFFTFFGQYMGAKLLHLFQQVQVVYHRYETFGSQLF